MLMMKAIDQLPENTADSSLLLITTHSSPLSLALHVDKNLSVDPLRGDWRALMP
jgi:hypothetical protein